jgi:hypothetical protein
MIYNTPQPYPQPPTKTNGNAITSLIMGIAGWVLSLGTLCFNALIGPLLTIATYGLGLLCLVPLGCIPPILWLVGIITGHIATSQIKRTHEGGQGMAVAGLIINWLGFVLIVGGTIVITILAVTGVIGLSWLSTLIPYSDYSY